MFVAVAHGSRDPRALPTVRALLARVRAQRPGLRVELGHLEQAPPLLGRTLAGLEPGSRAVLVPLLFGAGHHVRHDLPAAAAAAPHLRSEIAEPLGPHPLLADALRDRLAEAGWADGPGGAVVLAAAGSRTPESAVGTERTAALLSARLGGAPVLPGYASAATPTVADAVRRLRESGYAPDRIGVASCFTAPGHFAAVCARSAPGPAAAPLGPHPSLARLALHRYDAAALRLARRSPLPALGTSA